MVKKILSIAIVVMLAAFAGSALVHAGFYPTHDGEYHIIRFYEFNKEIVNGNWYPRWASDLSNGFGVPLFNYVYPLPNYIATVIHMFGVSFIDSFKVQMFLSLIFGGTFFYLWARKFWGDLGGVVSAVFYIFSPYHFVDIYIRGSVGEALALAIFPALLWSITVFIKTEKKIFIPLSSLLFALLIFSHNILALMFTPFIFAYVSFLIYKNKNRKKLAIECLAMATLGFMVSSIFWLPALLEKQYVRGLEVFDVSSNFPFLYQLLIPSWGSGFSGEGLQGQMSFQIGIANLLGVFLGFVILFFNKKKIKEKSWILFFLFYFLAVFFLMLPQSGLIWKTIPLMNYFQFPWRFLSLEIALASFLTGGAVFYFGRFKKLLAGFLILTAVMLGIGYMKPAHYFNRDDNYYVSRSNFIDGTNSPGNSFNTIWFSNDFKKVDKKFSVLNGKADIVVKNIESTNFGAEINASKDSKIIVNAAYFPGWSVYIDGKRTKTSITKDGLFSFDLAKGEHGVKVEFEDTSIRRIGVLGFYISAFILLSLFVW